MKKRRLFFFESIFSIFIFRDVHSEKHDGIIARAIEGRYEKLLKVFSGFLVVKKLSEKAGQSSLCGENEDNRSFSAFNISGIVRDLWEICLESNFRIKSEELGSEYFSKRPPFLNKYELIKIFTLPKEERPRRIINIR